MFTPFDTCQLRQLYEDSQRELDIERGNLSEAVSSYLACSSSYVTMMTYTAQQGNYTNKIADTSPTTIIIYASELLIIHVLNFVLRRS